MKHLFLLPVLFELVIVIKHTWFLQTNTQQPHKTLDYMYSFGNYGFDVVEFSPR